ncbi:MAG: hypothetical protein IPL65_15810 [Lewinellaceae bacterium]|nr:hypothetical protein [Lewinellaceae bacterium]
MYIPDLFDFSGVTKVENLPVAKQVARVLVAYLLKKMRSFVKNNAQLIESTRKRILGIDPGTNVLGFAVIDADKKGYCIGRYRCVDFCTHQFRSCR